MSSQAILPRLRFPRSPAKFEAQPGSRISPIPFGLPHFGAEDVPHRDAELFYLQKQIQSRTPMVIVLEDGERIEGCIEWYDHNSLKVRGRAKTLIYKSAIKFMYKLGDTGR